MNKGYILAIDQGTTGSTVLVFDHDGTARGKAYREFQQYYPEAWLGRARCTDDLERDTPGR